MSAPELTLADTLVGEAVIFFVVYEEKPTGGIELGVRINERIDMLGIVVQSLDVAGGNPETSSEHLIAPTSSFDHLWPSERILLFLLANYAALHAVLRRGDLQLPLIAPEAIAREILALEWISQEMTVESLATAFLAHPASQVRGE